MYHMELTRAGPICIRYLENAIQVAETWEMTQVSFWSNFVAAYWVFLLLQRLRNFAIVVSKKHKDWRKCKYCVAVKVDCPLLINCGGVTMELVQKVCFFVSMFVYALSVLSLLECFEHKFRIYTLAQNLVFHRWLVPLEEWTMLSVPVSWANWRCMTRKLDWLPNRILSSTAVFYFQ